MPQISRARQNKFSINSRFTNRHQGHAFDQEFGQWGITRTRYPRCGDRRLNGRDRVEPDNQLLAACIRDQNVLVSGAGGSIGSELCRRF